jgi:ABC-type multidrug transport system fused ATPase/permease subunit
MKKQLAAGLAGLSITYALQLTSQLNWLVRMSTDVENELVSVERVNQYSSLPSEAAPVLDTPPLGWPAAGDIKLENLSIRYRPSLPLVLTDINIHIKSREKIGIVGRTGSGKRFVLAIFLPNVACSMGGADNKIDSLH